MLGRNLSLVTQNLYKHLPWAGTIKFYEEYALPSPKLQGSVDNGDGLTSAQEQLLAVGMSVGTFILIHVDRADRKIIVTVISISGSYFLKMLLHVLQ